MKSFSKRVASFAMAAAMVFSLVAVSPADAEAASKYSLSKKSSITAGKTYTYKVKGVSKNQYIKVKMSSGVTVKYGSKKVKYNSTKITGGKTLSLKVKASDKVANYKATLKAIVYNKKNNKRVKGLTTTTTVKCTKFEITSVESATLDVTGSGIKYLIVKFNRAIDSLDASEVEIRNANTEELSSVGKVTLAKDGKSATVELLGQENTTIVGFLSPLIDYVMTITKGSATASLKFYIKDVRPNQIVTGVDATKNKIIVGSTSYVVPSSISVDYADILGKTVTFWIDKDNNIVKLNVAEQTPIFGAFKAVSSNVNGAESSTYVTLVNKADDTVKYAANSETPTVTNKATLFVKADGTGARSVASGNSLNYAKIYLNPNGTIRTAVVANPTPVYQVTSISNTTVRESATASKNLKDFTIVRDGKKIAVDAITAGEIVFVDNTGKFADVYTSKVEGVVTKVTTQKVTIDGKEYKYATAKYLDGDQTKTANEDYFINLKTAAKPATVWLDRTGDIVRASGDQGTVKTNTKEYVLTATGNTYVAANQHYIQLTGSNGTETSIPAIPVEKLTSIKVDGIKYYIAANTASSNDVTKEIACKSFLEDTTIAWGAQNVTNAAVSANKTDAQTTGASRTVVIDTTFTDTSLVKVTTDDKGTVIGIEAVNPVTKLSVSTNFVVKAGLTTLLDSNNKNYQLKSTTTVYDISTKNGASVVTATPYASFDKATDKLKHGLVKFYVDNGSVTAIIIDNRGTNNAYGVDSDKTVRGIVKDIQWSKDKVCDLTVITTAGEKVFTSFDNVASSVSVGNVVDVKYVGSTNTVKTISGAITKDNNANICVSTNAMAVVDNKITLCNNAGASDKTYTLSTSENPVIVKLVNGKVEVIDYSELQNIKHSTTTESQATNVEVYKLSEGDIVNFVIVKAGF